jgi:hypothetical protein
VNWTELELLKSSAADRIAPSRLGRMGKHRTAGLVKARSNAGHRSVGLLFRKTDNVADACVYMYS